MKFRNLTLALACMAAFLALGYLYVKSWVVQQPPFGIILFVSDGLVSRHLTMARLYEGGADHRLHVESFPQLALLRNEASDFAVPDDAAVATALATGRRGYHRHIGVDPKGARPVSLAQLCREKGRALGIVTNGALTDPIPAAFYAQTADSRETEALALQFVDRLRPDVAFGGGAANFLPAAAGGRRKDGRDLLAELRQKGCALARTKPELENVANTGAGVLGVFATESLAYADEVERAAQQPSLADMVRRAIRQLEQNSRGYLLIVDAALVGNAAGRNEGERAIQETLALDRAIRTAQEYAGEKSLILAVGKHSTGGLTLNGFPQRQAHGVALLGTSPEGYPYLTWATGPNGPLPAPSPASGNAMSAPGAKPMEPAAAHFVSALNTAEDVLALGVGTGAEKIRGVLSNTAVFQIIRDAL